MSKTRRRPGKKMRQNIRGSARNIAGQRRKDLSERSFSKIGLLAVLLIVVCVVVLAAHWSALAAQALTFDDHQYFAENLLVQNPGWASARRFLTEVLEPSTVDGYYQPLTMLSLMADYSLGARADNLRPLHRTSLALHMANTALVVVLLYLLFGRAPIAAGVGLLFGLHPMTAEPICWVGERKTLLAAFFALWCLVLYVRYSRRNDWRFYVGCIVMYVLALMSKPTSMPLPVLMLLMDYWPLGRLKRRAVLEKLPFFVVGGIFAMITVVSQSRTADLVPPGEYGPGRIVLILSHNIIFYLYKIVWPANLSSNYVFPEPMGLSSPMVLAGVLGTCILVPLLVLSLRRTRGALMGWLFFFIAILPTMQILRFSNVIAADKFAYLPSVGLLMVLASFLEWFCGAGKGGTRRAAVVVLVLILGGAEAVATRRQLLHWRDTVGLYEHMLTVSPDAPWVHYDLANALSAQGKLDEAISHYHRALQARPDYVAAHFNLANTLKSQGGLNEAISHYRQVLQLKPDYAEVFTNLGNALSEQGKLDEAVRNYRQALRFNPDSAVTHSNLGWELKRTGQLDEAIKHFREALRLEPGLLPSLFGISQVLSTHPDPKVRDVSEAIEFAERAAELTRYRDTKILDMLAGTYAAAGRFDQAVTTAQKALGLASAARNEVFVNHIRKRLELYRQAKP